MFFGGSQIFFCVYEDHKTQKQHLYISTVYDKNSISENRTIFFFENDPKISMFVFQKYVARAFSVYIQSFYNKRTV